MAIRHKKILFFAINRYLFFAVYGIITTEEMRAMTKKKDKICFWIMVMIAAVISTLKVGFKLSLIGIVLKNFI